MADIKRSKTRVKGFADEEMDFQLLRQLGSSAYGAASVGECLSIADRVIDGDPSSWVAEFTKQAEWEEQDAKERAVKGHRISARDQFFKACNSYRAAEYYTSCRTPEHRRLGLKARACFREAMQYVGHTFEAFKLPYHAIELPAYVMAPDVNAGRRKTLIIVSGFDGTLEEEYFLRGAPALARGYNIIHMAGPGQMDVFRFYADAGFEPDYERPVQTLIDYCAARPEIDPERLAILGISFGGYFATRAAAHEPRIKALIANSPILNLHAYLAAFVGYDPADAPDGDNFRVEDLPNIPDAVMSRQVKEMAENLLVRFRQPSFKETFVYLREFVVGDAVSNIHCPSLALVGTGEGGEPARQFQEFCDRVSGPVSSHQFTELEGADTHCQVGNPAFASAVTLDWLDELFG